MNLSSVIEVRPVAEERTLKRLVSLDNLWRIFVRMRGDLSPATLRDYEQYAKWFLPFMKGRDFHPMTMVAWMDYLRSRKLYRNGEPFSNYFINRVNARIKAFLRWLKAMGYIQQDLAALIPRLSTPAAKPSVMFTEEEYERMKRFCTGKNKYQVHLWLIILGYRTGMSLIDCAYLRWRDVHLDHNGPSYIDHYRMKNKRFGGKSLCQIPIIPGSDVHQWLLLLKTRYNFPYTRTDGITDLVHPEAPGHYQGSRYNRIQCHFKKIFDACGIVGKTFRNLRNSMCSNLVNSGTQIALVCKITGHSNITSLLKYVKPDRRALQDGMMRAQQFSASQAGIAEQATGFINAGDSI